MANLLKSRAVGIGYVIGVLGALVSSAVDVQAQEIPDGVTEHTVGWPKEISGVAAVDEGFLVVGNGTSKHYYSWLDGRPHRMWSDDRKRVCDAESIDVGYGPNGEELYVMLGEDFHTVYVRGAPSFSLPKEFEEKCGRGAEGMSVRWSDDGWDLLVLSEGGYYGKKHHTMDKNSNYCKPVMRELCANTENVHPPMVVRYRLSADGTTHIQEGEPFTLETAGLLERDDPDEAFRATDIAWYGDSFIVLLGSTPPANKRIDDSFRHTWIKGFDFNGDPTEGMTIKLESESVWGSYRRGDREWPKNWEALDTTLDGLRLILGYDADGSSEIVVFKPKFE